VRAEANLLERRRNDAACRRVVLGENSFVAPLEHPQLARECPGRAAEIRLGDHVIDKRARRVDPSGDRPERADRPADPEVAAEDKAGKPIQRGRDHALGRNRTTLRRVSLS
jgi:hypothetical protein